MALPASDSFTRANGGLGANWTDPGPQFQITSNQVEASSSSFGNYFAYWSADAPSNDQWASVTLKNLDAGTSNCGPAVRTSGGVSTQYWYAAFAQTGSCTLYRAVSNAFTQIGSYSGTIANGDTLKVEAVGTSISVYLNGALIIGPVTDNNVASGYGGIAGYTKVGLAGIDDFQVDNYTAPSSGVPKTTRSLLLGVG